MGGFPSFPGRSNTGPPLHSKRVNTETSHMPELTSAARAAAMTLTRTKRPEIPLTNYKVKKLNKLPITVSLYQWSVLSVLSKGSARHARKAWLKCIHSKAEIQQTYENNKSAEDQERH